MVNLYFINGKWVTIYPLKVTYINRSIYILEFLISCSFKGIWESKIQNVSFWVSYKYLVLLFKMTTRNEIVQAIIFHELIGKRKAAMD